VTVASTAGSTGGAMARRFESAAVRTVLWICLAGVFLTGIFQPPFVAMAKHAAEALIAAI